MMKFRVQYEVGLVVMLIAGLVFYWIGHVKEKVNISQIQKQVSIYQKESKEWRSLAQGRSRLELEMPKSKSFEVPMKSAPPTPPTSLIPPIEIKPPSKSAGELILLIGGGIALCEKLISLLERIIRLFKP